MSNSNAKQKNLHVHHIYKDKNKSFSSSSSSTHLPLPPPPPLSSFPKTLFPLIPSPYLVLHVTNFPHPLPPQMEFPICLRECCALDHRNIWEKKQKENIPRGEREDEEPDGGSESSSNHYFASFSFLSPLISNGFLPLSSSSFSLPLRFHFVSFISFSSMDLIDILDISSLSRISLEAKSVEANHLFCCLKKMNCLAMCKIQIQHGETYHNDKNHDDDDDDDDDDDHKNDNNNHNNFRSLGVSSSTLGDIPKNIFTLHYVALIPTWKGSKGDGDRDALHRNISSSEQHFVLRRIKSKEEILQSPIPIPLPNSSLPPPSSSFSPFLPITNPFLCSLPLFDVNEKIYKRNE